jgi:hypothetical protein
MDHDIIPDIIVLTTCAILIAWGLRLILFARAILTRRLQGNPNAPVSPNSVAVLRAFSVFWFCVGFGIAIYWFLEGRERFWAGQA